MGKRVRNELDALILGKQPPKERDMLEWALDLIHAVKTGDFRHPGGLHAQPAAVQAWFRHAQMNLLAVEVARIGTP